MLAQLQRYGAADNLFLPFKGRSEAAHPFLPVFACGLLHPADFLAQIPDKRLIGAKEEVGVFFDPESALFEDVADRRIG